jgi:hypothetical protein
MSDGQTKSKSYIKFVCLARSSSAMDFAVTDRIFHVYIVAFPRGAIHKSTSSCLETLGDSR